MSKKSPITQKNSAASTITKALKISAGTVLMQIFPKRRARMQQLATIPWHEEKKPDAIDRMIRTALLWWSNRDSSGTKLARLHHQFWRAQSSSSYYSGTRGRFKKVFLPHFDRFLDQIASEVKSREINCVIEIGCGDGQLLRHLQQRVPLDRHVGLDLSTDQINNNIEEAKTPKPEYYSGDASEWITAHATPHSLYVTGLGVLEYFTQAQLQSLLGQIAATSAPAIALFIEPVDATADFDNFDASYTAGEEHSFTHHYPNRLKEAGWTLIKCEEVQLSSYRWMVLIASCKRID